MELSRSDKLNLILLFLTHGPIVFYCKRHKWKYRPEDQWSCKRSPEVFHIKLIESYQLFWEGIQVQPKPLWHVGKATPQDPGFSPRFIQSFVKT